jgi:putative DNA primase/helicase
MNRYQEERRAAALEYAAKGWRVLPVGTNKKPINHNGSTGATTDVKQILAWWKESPFANIGVATGPESFWVVDLDMKDGVNGLESLNTEFGDKMDFDADNYLCATTATGGVHLLFQWPKQGVIRNAQGIFPGVDLRGEGGYIVVAPSARKIEDKYVQYTWNDGSLPISPAPEWARDLAQRQVNKVAQGVDLTHVMTGLTAGERDTELFRYACHLSSRGVPMELAKSFMAVAAERCTPPFNPMEAVAKIETAYSYERTKPLESRSDMLKRVVKESKHVK